MESQPAITPAPATYHEAVAAFAEMARQRDEAHAKYDRLRDSYEALLLELKLLKHRIFVAKAERVDSHQLELEFAAKLAALNAIAETPKPPPPKDKPKPKRPRPKGRRNLRDADLDEKHLEIEDPEIEKLVAEGRAKVIGFEESYRIGHKRGGMVKVVVKRKKYLVLDDQGDSKVKTAARPKEALKRSMAAPSMLAKVAVDKYCDGLPLFRIEDRMARAGFPIDRGTMSRWMEDIGATFGATVVAAARRDMMQSAFCIATDATGVAVQPEPSPDKKRQPCRKGHYFVLVADRDHIFFEYTPRETSQVVSEMFRDYSGYIQADAKSVYDILFRPPAKPPPEGDDTVRKEVGCWSHARRKFWEATWEKSVTGREGLARIGRIFEVDEQFKGKRPAQIRRLRNMHLRPHIEALIAWADEQYELVKDKRGTLRTAVGYVHRQKSALTAVLEDGRLLLDNNRSERALRRIAIGRKAWLFVGSDDHAHAAGHLFSLIASARLHGLHPEDYLRDVLRVLPNWPRERYLELAPKYWAATRARLDPDELAHELGPLTVPPPDTPEEMPPQ